MSNERRSMNKSRPGLLAFVVLIWIAYAVCGITIGLGSWIVKILGLTAVIAFGRLLFIVWKNKENKNELWD